MQRFFSSLSSLDAFTHSLKTLSQDSACQHCSKHDQWVSHGFIRKVRQGRAATTVGKRLFCSNRRSKVGCGRTRQLYIANCIPNRHYTATQVAIFITQLLAERAVEDAYRYAVGECEARQAWRWLDRLSAKLADFRHRVKLPLPQSTKPVLARSRQLRLLLEPLQQLLNQGASLPNFQIYTQQAFM